MRPRAGLPFASAWSRVPKVRGRALSPPPGTAPGGLGCQLGIRTCPKSVSRLLTARFVFTRCGLSVTEAGGSSANSKDKVGGARRHALLSSQGQGGGIEAVSCFTALQPLWPEVLSSLASDSTLWAGRESSSQRWAAQSGHCERASLLVTSLGLPGSCRV